MQAKSNRILQLGLILLLLSVNRIFYSQQYWTQVSTLFGAVTGFAVNADNELFAITYWNGVHKSTDKGLSWVQKNQGISDWNLYSILITPSGDMYVGSVNSGVFKSTDNGNQWIQTGLYVNAKIRTLAIDIGGNIYAGSHGRGIYRSTDEGSTWSNISNPGFVYSIAAAGNGYVFAGTGNPEAVFRSTDEGITFHQVTSGDQNFNTVIVCENVVYSITGSLETGNDFNFELDVPVNYKFVASTDHGDNWITRSTFGNSSFGITFNQNNVLFIGKYLNVLRTTDGGYNFTQLSSGINQSAGRIISLGCDSAGFIYLGQEMGNVYRSTETTIGIISQSNTIPGQYKLYQNYPNPFNPNTIINYQLAMSNHVKLIIYDATGKEAVILVSQKQNAGTYEVEWNASGFPSGIYFCKLTAGDYNKTIPMVLIK